MTYLLVCLLVMVQVKPVSADQRPEYTIYRVSTPISVDGQLDELVWVTAPDVGAFVFPGYESGNKEQTMAKALWDDENLYVAFICEDTHIWAERTKRDTSVGKDDTVEVFTVPNPERPQAYFNIEMNVQGIFLDQFHPDGLGVPVEEEWNGEGIQIKTSIVGILNDDNDEDQC